MKLPTELQELIWKHYISAEPRVMSLIFDLYIGRSETNHPGEESTVKPRPSHPVPSILQVSHNARTYGLTQYDTIVEYVASNGYPFYFNFEVDVLLFPQLLACIRVEGTKLPLSRPRGFVHKTFEDVQHVVFRSETEDIDNKL